MASKRVLRVLVVEDEDDDIAILRHVLQTDKLFSAKNELDKDDIQVAVDVTVVHDGEEALDYLNSAGVYGKVEHPKPDIILLDLKLRKKHGLETLEEIKSSKQLMQIPVVVLSGVGNDKDIDKALELGAVSYVKKPIKTERFINILRQVGAI